MKKICAIITLLLVCVLLSGLVMERYPLWVSQMKAIPSPPESVVLDTKDGKASGYPWGGNEDALSYNYFIFLCSDLSEEELTEFYETQIEHVSKWVKGGTFPAICNVKDAEIRDEGFADFVEQGKRLYAEKNIYLVILHKPGWSYFFN